ncbi:hypothetical protein KQX63_06860 [Rhodopseudomonas palustris]|uniref:hypothetical protein n=1 Tax=Rhodopseudomonas palustris TaxID=1076 RepID=UPI0021F38F0B|nr:hypothetical protein [Rhodopseudomonas palustris]UYO45728.1 hypothetical protein KQX63_06860 [Rhodopseudomonas palustris]
MNNAAFSPNSLVLGAVGIGAPLISSAFCAALGLGQVLAHRSAVLYDPRIDDLRDEIAALDAELEALQLARRRRVIDDEAAEVEAVYRAATRA